MKTRVPDEATEKRLEELRHEAGLRGRVDAPGIRPQGSPMPAAPAYYDLPLLKQPVWTWEVPLYFFIGGAAGASAVIASMAELTGADGRLVRDARMHAAIGAALSAPLLIADLGRPMRFLYMLRVFKPQSAMSVGAWTVAAFGAASTGTVLLSVGHGRAVPNPRGRVGGARRDWARRSRAVQVQSALGLLSAAAGLVMATYTGVLVGATAIPAWSTHAALLPPHFGASAVASAASLLELRGHRHSALQTLAMAAAAFETATGAMIEMDRRPASEPLRHGTTGTTMRIAGFFSGPLPLLLRIAGFRSKRARQAAAVSSVLGSLITRIAWVEAGRVSARDPHAAMQE
jgi:formate-dependent nitrite reductase membrane component NrfD